MNAAFILVLVWAFQMPGGKVNEGAISTSAMTAEQCQAKSDELRERNLIEQIKPKGGKILYSRFLCVVVPPKKGIDA